MLKQNNKNNLRFAILATGTTFIVFILLFFYIGFTHRQYSYYDSKTIAKEISRNVAEKTQNHFTGALMICRSMARYGVLFKEAGLERDYIVNMIKSTLYRSYNYLAVWTMWEPNAYDEKDQFYKEDLYYDSLGQLSVTFFRRNDSIVFENTNPDDYHDDFYVIPKNTQSELILEPYYYKYGGYDEVYYETSVIVPIFLQQKFAGVFGVDINLDSLQNNLKVINIYETGFTTLISNLGVIVSHPDEKYINKNFFDQQSDKKEEIRNKIQKGFEFQTETISEFTGERVFRFFYPVHIEGLKNPWSVMVEIPVKEVTSRSSQLTYAAIGTLLLGLLLLVYLIQTILKQRKYEKQLFESLIKEEENRRRIAESEHNYRILFENAQIGIFRTTPEGKFINANPTLLNILGYEHYEEIRELNMQDIGYYDDITRAEFIKEIEEKGRITNFEARWVNRKGEIIYLLENAIAIKDINEKTLYYDGFVEDITKRKNAENELKESEARYRSIIESFPDFLIVSDSESYIFYMNDIAQKMTGITPDLYKKTKWRDIIRGRWNDILVKEFENLLNEEKSYSSIIDFQYIDIFEQEHWFSGIFSKIKVNNVLLVQFISRDITEKKKAEDELNEHKENLEVLVKSRTEELSAINEELKSSNDELLYRREMLEKALEDLKKAQQQLIQSEKMASLGILAAGIAHEINNPLNFISGGIFGLEKVLKTKTHEIFNEAKPFISSIEEGVKRATKIVKGLSRYSRKDDQNLMSCDIKMIIDNCLMMLNFNLKEKIKVIKNYEEENYFVHGNEGRLHQAFLNIISNSEQAINEYGEIIINIYKQKSEIVVEIIDSGIGIEEKEILKITDPFYTTKAPGKGTGLGLSITYQIIKEHHGKLEINSTPKIGTRVKVILPKLP